MVRVRWSMMVGDEVEVDVDVSDQALRTQRDAAQRL